MVTEIGQLCVNEVEGAFSCFHRAHAGSNCTREYDGGPGRSSSCPCKENKQVSQWAEDILVLKRNVPRWEWVRISRLAGATNGN